jgi:FkbM family methyltransferase
VKIEELKDFSLEKSSLARRIYGFKLRLQGGSSDASRWFLSNREKLKYGMKLAPNGLVLDIGSYLGEFTQKVLNKNPDMTFCLYEPIPKYFSACADKYKDRENIIVHQKAVSADGRDITMQINSLRSRQQNKMALNSTVVQSESVQKIFDSVINIELMKINIEGMEYECLEQLMLSDSLIKARHLLIQFHNFESDSQERRTALRNKIEQDFNNIYTFEWVWELWIRKE